MVFFFYVCHLIDMIIPGVAKVIDTIGSSKSGRLLFDALHSLAIECGPALAQPPYPHLLLPPLMKMAEEQRGKLTDASYLGLVTVHIHPHTQIRITRLQQFTHRLIS
jgi:hypothetical protein